MRVTVIAALLMVAMTAIPTVARAHTLTRDEHKCVSLLLDRWYNATSAATIEKSVTEIHIPEQGPLEMVIDAVPTESPLVDYVIVREYYAGRMVSRPDLGVDFLCNAKANVLQGFNRNAPGQMELMLDIVAHSKFVPRNTVWRYGMTEVPPRRRQSCNNPNVEATTTNAVAPDTPPDAQQQGISGVVNVVVQLGVNNQIVGTPTVQSSPSKLLNEPAIIAAEHSTFRTEISNCKPIAATYIFAVEFNNN